MNAFQKLILKALGVDFNNVESPIYQAFSKISGFGFSFNERNFKNFLEDGYVKGTDVRPVVDRIIRNASSVPFVLKEKLRDGTLQKVENSRLNEVLLCPNRMETWADFLESCFLQYLLTGNLYVNGVTPEGFPMGTFKELTVLPSAITKPLKSNDALNPIAGYEVYADRPFILGFEDVLHVKYADPRVKGWETLEGLSPLEAGMFAYESSNQKWEASANILKNRGAIGILSNESDIPLTPTQMDAAQEAWQSKFGGGKNYGKPFMTSAKMKWQNIALSPQDLQLIESGVMSLRAICNIYQIDSSLFNDPANKTFNNRKEAAKSMWQDAVIPLLESFTQSFNNWVVANYSEAEGRDYVLTYDLSNISVLHEDKDKQADRVTKLVSSGIITPNEAREMIGLEILPDDGMDRTQLGGTVATNNEND